MKKFILFGLLSITLFTSFGQQKHLPNKQETFNYIRNKLLTLSTKDGENGTVNVKLDEKSSIMKIYYENEHYDEIFLDNLDSSFISWDIFNLKNDKILRLTISSRSGVRARNCYDSSYDAPYSANKCNENITVLMFSLPKAAEIPNFQDKLAKAVKRLIMLCGGAQEEHDPFGN